MLELFKDALVSWSSLHTKKRVMDVVRIRIRKTYGNGHGVRVGYLMMLCNKSVIHQGEPSKSFHPGRDLESAEKAGV